MDINSSVLPFSPSNIESNHLTSNNLHVECAVWHTNLIFERKQFFGVFLLVECCIYTFVLSCIVWKHRHLFETILNSERRASFMNLFVPHSTRACWLNFLKGMSRYYVTLLGRSGDREALSNHDLSVWGIGKLRDVICRFFRSFFGFDFEKCLLQHMTQGTCVLFDFFFKCQLSQTSNWHGFTFLLLLCE